MSRKSWPKLFSPLVYVSEAGDGAVAATGVAVGCVFARDGWRNPRGKLCAASAPKALPRLAEHLGLALPPAGGAGAVPGRVCLQPAVTEAGAAGTGPTPARRRLCADLLWAGNDFGVRRQLSRS